MEYSIEKYIPQRKPFIFVDKIINHTQQEITTSFKIKEENILVNKEKLQESGLIENMAQSAAALEGANALLLNREVKIGFIGSVKKLKIFRQPSINETIETTVSIINNAIGINIAQCTIKSNNELVAEAILNIFIKD